VATISRLLKIIVLSCRILSLLQGSFAKETCNFREPTNRSHPVKASQPLRILELSCKSFFAKELLSIGLFCGKWPIKIRHPMGLRHHVSASRLFKIWESAAARILPCTSFEQTMCDWQENLTNQCSTILYGTFWTSRTSRQFQRQLQHDVFFWHTRRREERKVNSREMWIFSEKWICD